MYHAPSCSHDSGCSFSLQTFPISILDVLVMAITAPFFYYTVKTARPLFQFVKYQLTGE